MAKVTSPSSNQTAKPRRPALTPEARENQLIDAAVALAERQLLDGTASSQVITHYLKLATVKEQQERKKLEEEIKLLRAKTNAIENSEVRDQLYKEAIAAMRRYSGHGDENEY